MLQQTQVDRVIPFYRAFLKRFPTVTSLAHAPLIEVLRAWQGLGYNRRGKYLRDAAQIIVRQHASRFPKRAEDIEALPGVGHYTARAICAFAYNTPDVFIETNIRTVFTHHFFPYKKSVTDAELLLLITKALSYTQKNGISVRDWYAALMDYGAHLKKSGIKINSKSKHYTKQSKFEGSRRQESARELRKLIGGGASESALRKFL